MIIRRAVAGDWPQIWPFWHRIVAAGETYHWAPDTDEHTAAGLWMVDPPGVVYVVEDDGSVVASARLQPNYAELGDHIANASFMVDPDHVGRGIGRRLAEHVLDEARAQGYAAMQFNSVVDANPAAVALWTSLGFRVLGTVPAAFRHHSLGRVGVHVMYREL